MQINNSTQQLLYNKSRLNQNEHIITSNGLHSLKPVNLIIIQNLINEVEKSIQQNPNKIGIQTNLIKLSDYLKNLHNSELEEKSKIRDEIISMLSKNGYTESEKPRREIELLSKIFENMHLKPIPQNVMDNYTDKSKKARIMSNFLNSLIYPNKYNHTHYTML